jgi:hypothetical protein
MAGLQKTGCEGGLRRRRLDDRALLQSMVAIKTLNGKSKLLKNIGGMAEWSMAAVLKTVDPQGSGGSNPSSSASSLDYQLIKQDVHDFVHETTDFSVVFCFCWLFGKSAPGCPNAPTKITS